MRRILTLLTAVILMAAMMAASAAPAFAVPEHFLVNAVGPPPEALPGLLIAESKTKSEVGSKPSTGDFVITKVVDKATP